MYPSLDANAKMNYALKTLGISISPGTRSSIITMSAGTDS